MERAGRKTRSELHLDGGGDSRFIRSICQCDEAVSVQTVQSVRKKKWFRNGKVQMGEGRGRRGRERGIFLLDKLRRRVIIKGTRGRRDFNSTAARHVETGRKTRSRSRLSFQMGRVIREHSLKHDHRRRSGGQKDRRGGRTDGRRHYAWMEVEALRGVEISSRKGRSRLELVESSLTCDGKTGGSLR